MPFSLSPISTSFDAASSSNTALLQALLPIIGASTYWQVVHASGTGGDAGITIKNSLYNYHVNLRPVSTSIGVLMDYDGAITDPTDPAASATDPSLEETWSNSQLDGQYSFHEWEDCFCIVARDGINISYALMAGSIGVPFFQGDVDDELDGTGYLMGLPARTNSNGYWLSSSEGQLHISSGNWIQDFGTNAASTIDMNDLNIGGLKTNNAPVPMVMEYGSARALCTLKYVFGWPNTTVGTVVRAVGAGQDFAALATSNTCLLPIEYGFDILADA